MLPEPFPQIGKSTGIVDGIEVLGMGSAPNETSYWATSSVATVSA